MKWTIDPGLEGDAYADKPYLYGAALSSWNYLRVCGVGKGRVGGDMVGGEGRGSGEDEVIEEGGEGGGEELRRKLNVPDDPVGRRRFFLLEGNRDRFVFEEGRLYKADFGNGYLGFNGKLYIHLGPYINNPHPPFYPLFFARDKRIN